MLTMRVFDIYVIIVECNLISFEFGIALASFFLRQKVCRIISVLNL